MDTTNQHPNTERGFLQYLEDLAFSRHPAQIRFIAENGGVANIRSGIKAVNEEEGNYTIELEDGFAINLDQLVTVNGYPGGNVC